VLCVLREQVWSTGQEIILGKARDAREGDIEGNIGFKIAENIYICIM